MERKMKKDKKELIAFIGPMCVGKSTISELVGEKMKRPVICLDALLSYMRAYVFKFRGVPSYQTWDWTQREVFKNSMSEEKYLEQKEEIDKKIKAGYEELLEYDRVCHLTELINEFYLFEKQIMSAEVEEPRDIAFLHSYCELSFLNKMLDKVTEPAIFDLSGGIGSILKNQTGMYIGGSYFEAESSFEKIQKAVLERFGAVIYIAPGRGYEERYNDEESKPINACYFEDNESFVKFADIMITTHDLFYNNQHEIFKAERDDYNLDNSKLIKELRNKAELNNICDEVICAIDGLTLQTVEGRDYN